MGSFARCCLRLTLRLTVPLVAASLGAAPMPIGDVGRIERLPRGLALHCTDGARVELTVLAADLVRIRALFAGQAGTPDHSWAVARTDWPEVAWTLAEEPGVLRVATEALEVVVGRSPLLVEFRDRRTGRVLNADARPMIRDSETGRVGAAKRLGVEERFYGLGEKAARLDRRRLRLTMWNSDTPGYTEGTDPIYQSIPFYLGMERGVAYGIFYDNSHRSTFDLGHGGQEAAEYAAEGGVLDYYFLAGPHPKQVVSRYTELTGRMPLPPLWALGHQQSRFSYYPQETVARIAALFRENDLPLDALYLDIHYMHGYRVFTWDPARFPDPGAMIQGLGAQGVKVVAIVDPGVKYQPPTEGAAPAGPAPERGPMDDRYYVFDQGLAAGHFLRRGDGSLYLGEVWPGRSVFVDYTREEARRWWGGLHRGLLDYGVAGIWTDMNEPSDFLDKTGASQHDVVFDDRGTRTLYGKHRNLFALNMARATYEGLERLQPDRRPFVITRAGYAGIQRYATVWTGDNNARWESLALNIPMFASLGLSGEAFVGADVPGFIGRATPELLVRSYQMAFLAPLCRNHASNDAYDHEPWRFGPVYTDIVRRYLQLRYRLLPFLYTTLEEAHRTGVPLFRPLLLNFPDDANLETLDDQYMIGDTLLAAPVLQAGERARDLYLPAGLWYEFFSAAPVEGGRLIRVEVPLERTALYVRGGRILPSTEPMRHVGEKPWDPIRFDIYPDSCGSAQGSLYEDDGESPAYRRGQLRRTFVRYAAKVGEARIEWEAPESAYRPAARHLEFIVHDAPGVSSIELDGQPLPAAAVPGGLGWWRSGPAVTLRLADDGRAHQVRLH